MRASVVPIIILALLAGCAEEPPEEEAQAPLEPGIDIGAPQVPLDREGPQPNWFVGHKNGTDLAAFPFHVPADATVEYSPVPSFTFEAVILELSVVAPGPLDAWAVYAFDMSRSEAAVLGSVISTSSEGEFFNLLPTGSSTRQDAYVLPTWMFLSEDAADSDIALVLATRGASGPVSLSWRLMDEYPSFSNGDERPEDHQAFVAQRTGPAGVVEPMGTGNGFTFDSHLEIFVGSFFAPVGTFGYVLQTGEVEMHEEWDLWVAPYGGARQSTLRIDGLDSGWSRGGATYWPGNGAGTFDVTVDAHGNRVSDSGVAAYTAAPVGGGVQPLMSAYAVGEGNGTSQLTLDLTAADSNDFFILDASMESFGTPLQDLLGKPAAAEAFTWPGIIFPSPEGVLRWSDAPAQVIVR